MSAAVFSIILFAAVLHATWNAIVKIAPDKAMTATLVSACGALISLAALPFLQQPAAASWPFLALSTVLQVTYYRLLGGAYRAADMSQVYPLMRGTAPLIVALFTALFLGERLSPFAWAGVLLVSGGVVGGALAARGAGNGRGAAIALTNAVFIAGYTISDGIGVRASGSPAAYTMWLFVLTAIPLVTWSAVTRPEFPRYALRNAWLGLAGGAGTLASYGLALWGMTVAPVAVVAALRETSILFAMAIAGLILKERVGVAKLAGALAIAAGAIALRLA
jgi:drug/metabolite transporter (DMT)-like permease